MKLFFRGHQERYAIEQMLFTLFPGEHPEYPDARPGGDNELELSFHIGLTWMTASARLRRGGSVYCRIARLRRPARDPDPVLETRLRRRTLQRAFYRAAVDALGAEPPWGMLSGVRPVKLPVRAVMEGKSLSQAEAELRDLYRVTKKRRALAMACAKESLLMKQQLKKGEVSLYVGIPFCPTRCTYCSFISASGQNNKLISPYLDSLLEEIHAAGRAAAKNGLSVRSLYIGGGTPTTLSPLELSRLLEALHAAFSLGSSMEITVEAGRPDTITKEKLQAIREGGGNRISLNPQSMSDKVLQAIGRAHRAEDILSSWDLIAAFGFRAVNMDLIAGLPADSVSGFQDTLSNVLALSPENITVHTLALKRGSALKKQGDRIPDHGDVSHMLDHALDALYEKGYHPYYLYRQKNTSGSFENVGWCKPGFPSEYNICMMEELHTVLSLGAGGMTKIVDRTKGTIRRISNPKYPQEYIRDSERIQNGWAEFSLFRAE